MPKTKRTPQVTTRLAAPDYIQFELLCRLEAKTKTEMARKAITWYIENHEKLMNEERDSALEKRLKAMENRICNLMAKIGIEVCSQGHLFWTRAEKETRQQLFQECWTAGVRRMRSKLEAKEEKELLDGMKSESR